MDRDSIEHILFKIGAEKVRVSGDREVYASCPFARYGRRGHKSKKDNTPSFSIKIDDHGPSPYRCWGCNASGTIDQMVDELAKLDPKFEELKVLVEEEVINNMFNKLEKVHKKFDKSEEARIDKMIRPETELDPFSGSIPDYAFTPKPDGCGLSKEMAETWMVGGDDYGKRVVFPVRENGGGLVGMVGRTTVDDSTKYFNYWNFKKGEFLYGENFIDPDFPPNEVVIVEGITDTIIGNDHVKDLDDVRTLGIFGAHASETQINKIVGLGSNVVHIMLDGDDAGKEGAAKLEEKLNGRVKHINTVILPKNSDPGNISREDFLGYIGKST